MPTVNVFYSTDEINKPAAERVHHNHTDCPAALRITGGSRRPGTGLYRLCHICNRLSQQELLLSWLGDESRVASYLKHRPKTSALPRAKP